MLKALLPILLIVGVSVAFLAVKILLKRNGRFPNTHIGGSAAMRKRGITCVESMDAMMRKPNPRRTDEHRKKDGTPTPSNNE